MKIGVDLDGPLFHFTEAYLHFHNRIYGTSFTIKDITEYDMSRRLGVSHEQHGKDIFSFFDSPEFLAIRPFFSAIKQIRDLAEEHELCIVTARSTTFRERTAVSVERYYNGCFRGIYHATDNAFQLHADKSEICKQLGLDFLIEDSLRNAVEVMEAGIPTTLISRPWNKQELLPPYLRRTRWSNIQQVIKKTLVRSNNY